MPAHRYIAHVNTNCSNYRFICWACLGSTHLERHPTQCQAMPTLLLRPAADILMRTNRSDAGLYWFSKHIDHHQIRTARDTWSHTSTLYRCRHSAIVHTIAQYHCLQYFDDCIDIVAAFHQQCKGSTFYRACDQQYIFCSALMWVLRDCSPIYQECVISHTSTGVVAHTSSFDD